MIEAAPLSQTNVRKLIPLTPVRRTVEIPDEKPQEECGLISFYAPNGMTATEASRIFVAAEGVQHRGQQGGGVVAHALNGESYIHRGAGLLTDALPGAVQQDIADLGMLRSVTIQARYGTDGGYEPKNLQPLELRTENGTQFEVATNGQFANKQELQRLSGKTYQYDASDARIWTDSLPHTAGDTHDELMATAVGTAVGAASLIININKDTQYAAKDIRGIRPLVLGSIVGERGPIWIVASETRAMELIDATVERDIRPGEIIKFDTSGITVLEKGDKTEERMCAMEMAYLSHPESRVNVTSNGSSPETWPSHKENRFAIGEQIAREDKAREIAERAKAIRLGKEFVPFIPDIVIGIPDSGKAFGKGYAQEMGAPYKQLITKDPDTKTRTFQTDDQINQIRTGILKKLSVELPEDWDWEGKKIVLVDDSLVRGSVSTTLTEVLNELGAEVHWRFGFPKISHPCHLGVSIRTYDELIAHRRKGDEVAIANEIRAASVQFISNRGFVESVQGDHFEPTSDPTELFDKNRMCGGCITGSYPYSREEAVYERPATLVS